MPALYDIVWSTVYPTSLIAVFLLGRALWRRYKLRPRAGERVTR